MFRLRADSNKSCSLAEMLFQFPYHSMGIAKEHLAMHAFNSTLYSFQEHREIGCNE